MRITAARAFGTASAILLVLGLGAGLVRAASQQEVLAVGLPLALAAPGAGIAGTTAPDFRVAELPDFRAAELPDTDIAGIRNAILGQLAAFRADDAGAAFSYAAPGIREIFGTPEMFLHMVRRTYPAVYRPRTYAFRDIRIIDGNTVQPLAVVGPSGVPETALYIMERQPGGDWKIGACIMAREPARET
ncbi:MAG: DUF4864 domain-containing protein [Rhodospirillaceae bacterium]